MLNPNFLLAHRNGYSKVTDDGKITPREYANFKSYIKNLRVLVFMTDRWMEKLIRGGLGNYLSIRGLTG
jgi:hypothetical protein